MGIINIMPYIDENREICRPVSIESLVESDPRRTIVVDGNVFLTTYVNEHYQWIIGGTTELAESIRDFVNSFNNFGIKLLFVFNEHYIYDKGDDVWEKHRADTLDCTKSVLQEVRKNVDMMYINSNYKKAHNIHDLHCWVVSLLRDLNCEVFCYLKDRVWHTAIHAQSDDCLAILSQSSYFLFFTSLRALFFSLARLDLRNMTTKMYSRKWFAEKVRLNTTFFPLLATLLGTSHKKDIVVKKQVFKKMRKMGYKIKVPSTCVDVSRFITENFDPLKLNDIPNLLLIHFPDNAEYLVDKYTEYKKLFNLEVDDLGNETTEENDFNNWEKIKVKCQELFNTGLLCNRIHSVIHAQSFELRATLEDFVDLPSCNLVYKRLRKQMFSILLHEATDFMETVEVREWCIEEANHPKSPVTVLPDHVDSSFHPGLLSLWDSSNETLDFTENKWKLFAAAISPTLDYTTLRDLPKSLVIPVALLYYLFRISFRSPLLEQLLKPWEVEVFLLVALRLPYSDKIILKTLFIHQVNTRAIILSSMYIHGSDILNMLAQSCGLELGERYTSIWNFFDGKLFQNMYEKALSGAEIINSEEPELFEKFNSIRSLIFECVPF